MQLKIIKLLVCNFYNNSYTIGAILGFLILNLTSKYITVIQWVLCVSLFNFKISLYIDFCVLLFWWFSIFMSCFIKFSILSKTSLNCNFIMILFNSLILMCLFLSTIVDFVTFYVLFELVTFPLIILVGLCGFNFRRIWAFILFMLLLIFSGLFGILLLTVCSFNLLVSDLLFISSHGFNILMYSTWFMILIMIKIPSFPFIFWLPEVHVESSIESSIILASLLLKVSLFGSLRFYFMFWTSFLSINIFTTTVWISLGLASCFIIFSIDFKRIIAFSSITHMNFSFINYSQNDLFNIIGVQVCIISHGLLSCFMFYLSGTCIESLGSRSVCVLFLNTSKFPLLHILSLLSFLSNVGFPVSISFIMEFCLIFTLISSSLELIFVTYFAISFGVLVGIFNLYFRVFLVNFDHLIVSICDLLCMELAICYSSFSVLLCTIVSM